MTTEHDSRTPIVTSWLREDAHENAELVLLRVLDEVDTTPQRRSWWPARRTMHMNPAYKVALAAAAVLVAAIVGYNVLPSARGPGVPTIAPTPVPTEAPTVSPSPTVPPIPPEGRALEPGQYAIQVPDSEARALVTVEAGWTSGSYFIMNPPAFSKQVSFWTIGNVYRDICDIETGGLPTASDLPIPAVGPTVDDLVAALDAQVNTDMSPPVDVTVGGYSGKRVAMVVSDPYDHCIGDFIRPMWVDAAGEPQRGLQPGDPDTLWIVDVEGHRVVIVTNDQDSDPDAPASIAAVIDSIEFEVP
jgi:hypothetical protein